MEVIVVLLHFCSQAWSWGDYKVYWIIHYLDLVPSAKNTTEQLQSLSFLHLPLAKTEHYRAVTISFLSALTVWPAVVRGQANVKHVHTLMGHCLPKVDFPVASTLTIVSERKIVQVDPKVHELTLFKDTVSEGPQDRFAQSIRVRHYPTSVKCWKRAMLRYKIFIK